MRRPNRSAAAAAVGLVSLLVLAATPLGAQERPEHPFALTFANLRGGRVFTDKGCGLCHAIRGLGGMAGPDLSRIERKGFFDLGAAMSNHLRGINIRKPPLSAEDVTGLISFLFTLQYQDVPGDPKAGEALFGTKGCVQCHEVGGKGGRRGPSLDFLKSANSPVLVAAALWNHGPDMGAKLESSGIQRPTFEGQELADIISYITAAARDGGGGAERVVPGVPEQGQKVFAAKRCVACHSAAGKGGKVGPELARGHHVSLTQFAGLMWNHAPGMWAQMEARGIQVPRLKGQEMADIVAFLYVSQYFDEAGNRDRGRAVAETKGCLACHAAGGRGGKIGADLGTYRAARSSSALVAALWNHPRYLEARRQEVPWPSLTGTELADLSTYLGSLPRPAVSKTGPPSN